ncbi:MAG TPA: metallophosphoesterase family protein [Burkholderiales bacterium]|nr:metallophosphoesterase family protein [Burkholderiales bacterium]
MEIGVISDTHGLLREEAVAQLCDSDLILHAGDIGSPAVLAELGRIARVVAVRGNNDRDGWALCLPVREIVELCGISICMLHDVNDLDGSFARCPHDVVIAGHSHRPLVERRDGVLLLNPGSAGPRRFRLPVTVARLRIRRGAVQVRVIELDV